MAPKTAGPNWALFTLWIWLMTATATANGVVIMIGGGKTLLGKALYPELTADVTGGIARFKPIRLDLLARDATCAAEARGANASILDQTASSAAIDTDIRQIKVLLRQAGGAITKAVSDGDMTPENASTLGDLLEQSAANLTPAKLKHAVPQMAAACGMFD